jgi:hypothetical protein
MALCKAHSARTGLPCQKHTIAGASVCRTHGGASTTASGSQMKRISHSKSLLGIPRLQGYSRLSKWKL